MEHDYREKIEIDSDRLDQEWERQAITYFDFAEKAASCEAKVRRMKDKLELVYAELDEEIRCDPKEGKLTEAAVKSAILRKPKYREATEDLLSAQEEKGILDAVVASMEHKKKALERLVDLHLSSYHSSPRNKDETPQQRIHGKIVRKLNT